MNSLKIASRSRIFSITLKRGSRLFFIEKSLKVILMDRNNNVRCRTKMQINKRWSCKKQKSSQSNYDNWGATASEKSRKEPTIAYPQKKIILLQEKKYKFGVPARQTPNYVHHTPNRCAYLTVTTSSRSERNSCLVSLRRSLLSRRSSSTRVRRNWSKAWRRSLTLRIKYRGSKTILCSSFSQVENADT